MKLTPVVAQDARTNEILMLAYADARALRAARRTGLMHYWSRSRDRLWKKGETSGNTQRLVSLHRDCDGDALLARVEQRGPACHLGRRSCFGEVGVPPRLVDELWRVFEERRRRPSRGSFTRRLLEDPQFHARKILEEASELAMALRMGRREEVVAEASDLQFLVYLALFVAGARPEHVEEELRRRRRRATSNPRGGSARGGRPPAYRGADRRSSAAQAASSADSGGAGGVA